MKTIIHVNQHAIKDKGRRPVITCKNYRRTTYAHEVEIHGPCRLVYRPDKPLKCGARVWIETEGHVFPILHGQEEAA